MKMSIKIVSMTPVRLGSKRIKNKNLRLLAGKPLVAHAIEKCKQVGIFDEIYINSEADIFKGIADEYGVKFYKRPEELASDEATNDQFVLDFITKVKCDILIQVNSTSPLITVDDIKKFVDTMLKNDYDTLHGVKMEQIEALYNNKPLNYEIMSQMPRSQTLTPTMYFCSALMGWKTQKFIENMKKYNCATFGGKGKTGYFVLEGLSTIDIDTEEDWQMAELAMKYRDNGNDSVYEYYQPKGKIHSEKDVLEILKLDGVVNNQLFEELRVVYNLGLIMNSFSKKTSWSKRIINTKCNSATLICQLKGEGNRLHYHVDWDEWWLILRGQWLYEVEGKETVLNRGDVVLIKRGLKHKITAVSDEPAVRLAVSRADVVHVYPEDGEQK
jgi:CMP-N-acetylneuraminic acid synthetase/quercetin dioxygenase-like cupin family protein